MIDFIKTKKKSILTFHFPKSLETLTWNIKAGIKNKSEVGYNDKQAGYILFIQTMEFDKQTLFIFS